MISTEQLPQLYGTQVTDPDGTKIGTVGSLWTDESGRPTWASVRTGLFGMNESLVPLHQAEIEGDHVRVPYAKDQVKDAPNVDASADEPLGGDEIGRLYEHYHLGDGHQGTDDQGADHRTGQYQGGGTYESGPYTGGATYTGTGSTGEDLRDEPGGRLGGEDAMTRSGERPDVGTEQQDVARARLRRYVVTEQVGKERIDTDLPDEENRTF